MKKIFCYTLVLSLLVLQLPDPISADDSRTARPFSAPAIHTGRGAEASRPEPSASAPGADPVHVLTHRYNKNRNGANLQETVLNVANVNARQFGKLFSRAVDGYMYAQPLYVSQLGFPDQSTHNVVFVATERNSVYAFDADDPDATSPLWHANLGAPVASGDLSPTYRDLVPEVGITSTPVIDLAGQTIFLVAKSKDAADGSYRQRLHALDLTTGQDRPGSPVEITASVPGTGAGAVDGAIPFNPLLSLNRPGLLLLNGVVYIGFGSHGNIGEHHGWLFGYDARTLERVAVFNTSPDSEGGSIWMSGQGLLADENDNIYVTTGNGPFNLRDGKRDYGDCALKFSTKNGLTLVDYFTPHNTDVLNQFDIDLGAGGPVLLPGLNRLLFAGKDTVLRVLDTNSLGGFDPLTDHIVQQFQPSPRRMFSAPVYWNSPTYGPVIYYWAGGDNLKVFKLLDGKLQEYETALSTVVNVTGISNAAPMTLSANGSRPGTGILWATGPTAGDANRSTVPGILRAFDASDVTRELWNSQQNAERDEVGNFAKFCPPTVANGKVYLATFSGQLQVFGLLPGQCNFSLLQTSQFVNSGEENGDVGLAVETDCNWLAGSNDDWISINSGAEETGSGTVFYSVAPNPSGLVRTGTLSIAGLNYTIKQAGAAAVASAASFDTARLASESIASALSSHLATGTGSASAVDSANNKLPTSLAGTTLKLTDSTGTQRQAPLFFVSPFQINFQIPAGTASGTALATITSADGNIATGAIQIAAVAPGIFSANATGQGIAAGVALRVKSSGAQVYEALSQFDPAQQKIVALPIDLGADPNAGDQVFLILFSTGVRFRSELTNVKVEIGGVSAPVAFAGAQGSFVGLDQINVLLPRTLIGKGEADVTVKVDGVTANTVRVSIK